MTSTPQPRLLSIDLDRGLTTALMILVNEPGDPHQVYAQLRHAEWNGYTAADLVFPNFLFLSGASLVFSLQSKLAGGRTPRWELARGLARRSVHLLLLKFFVAQAPTFRRRRIRVFGVLFRTSLLSLAAGLILLETLAIPRLLALSAALLAAYHAVLRIPFAGLNQPFLDPENNAAAWLDRRVAHVFHGHLHHGALYHVTHDPEGLLSSVPALATVLLGACAALVLRDRARTPAGKVATLAGAGAVSLAMGLCWSRSFPVNKNLWTSSYVLVAGGWSALALAVLYAIFDLRKPARGLMAAARPALILGANSIVAYALSLVTHKLARTVQVSWDGHKASLRTSVYRKVLARKHSTPLRSLAFAAACLAFCFVPNYLLDRRKIYIRL